MNLRITSLFFALLLTMLWVFGYMVAHKKAAGDTTLIFPKLADVKIEKVQVAQTDKGDKTREATFEAIGDKWFLKAGKEKVRVDGFRIENIIRAIKEAKHDDTADVSKQPSHYGLDNPKIAVTLHGKQNDEDKTWEFFVGNEVAGVVFVNTGDKKDRVFAVGKRSMENLSFKDPNYFRSKKIFEFTELSVTKIDIKPTDKDLADKPLVMERGDNSRWNFLTPAWGLADFGAEPEEDKKKKDPHKEFTPPPARGGVKGLLNDLVTMRVEDDEHFVPLGKGTPADYGVELDKAATLRIDVTSTEGDKKPVETLVVGKKVKIDKTDYYYVRVNPLDDDGVMQVSERYIKPILEALGDRGKLRSRDVAAFDKKDVDVVTIKPKGKDEVQFFKGEKAEAPNPMMPFGPTNRWDMVLDKKKQKGSDIALTTLLNAVLGKKAIVGFHDGTEAELKGKEAEWGLDTPAAELKVYLNAIDASKKDEKKDDKKSDKKEEKKEEKTAETTEPLPAIKDKHKPEITLAIGKVDKDKDVDIVHVRRELKDGTKTYFTMKKEFADLVVPPEGIELTYLDTSVPEFAIGEVSSMRLQRTTDKGPPEVIELEPRGADGKTYWYVKDKTEPTGARLADSKAAESILNMFSRLHVKKWLRPLKEKEDIKPAVSAAINVKRNQVAARSITVKGKAVDASPAAGVVGLLANPLTPDLSTIGFALAARELDEGETVTIELGKETDVEKDKPGILATHSGSKLLFLAEPGLLKQIQKEDLRDRTAVLHTQTEIHLMLQANARLNPVGQLMFASPLFTGQIHQLKASKIKKVDMTVRTPYEERSFQFVRVPKKEEAKPKEKAKDDKDKEKIKDKDAKASDKDKEKDKVITDEEKEKAELAKWTWEDKSGFKGFTLDPDKAAELVKDFAKLRTDRFVSVSGVKRSDYKLDLDKASVKLDLWLDDDKTPVTVLIGTNYQHHGYFATSTQWPGAVFFAPLSLVEPILEGTRHFAKERIGVD